MGERRRYWISTPSKFDGYMTVEVDTDADGVVLETFTAWPEFRGRSIDQLLDHLRQLYGGDLIWEKLK